MIRSMLLRSGGIAAFAWSISATAQAQTAEPPAAPETSQPSEDQSDETAVADPSEIVVTARKREERALDVPIALTAFNGEALEERGARNLADVLQESPGVGIFDQGNGISKLTIRGISTSLGANENGYYLDDLPFTGVTVPLSPDVRAWDLDRVEVLRGPQGTLFGEGSMGGTVRILTNGADLDEWEVKGGAFLSSTEDGGTNHGLRGAVNLPLAPGVFAVRVAGTTERFDGWLDDPANGRSNVNDAKFDTLRIKARLDPTDRLSITGSYWFYEGRFPGGGSNGTDEGDISASVVLANKVKYKLFGLSGRYDFGKAELFYGFAKNKFDLPQSGNLFGGTLDAAIGVDVDSHELRLASSAGGPLQWTVGAYYRKAGRKDVFLFPLFGLDNTDVTNSKAGALFAEATYTLPSVPVDVTAGLRYYREKLSGFEVNAGEVTEDDARTYKSWNPRFSVAWHPQANVNIYASVAKGFRAGQFQPTASVALGEAFGIELPPSLDQDSIWSYELGAKADLLGRALTVEGAVFYSDWKDVTVRIPIATTGFNGLINSSGTRTKGIELNLVGRPMPGLTLQAGGALIDAEYKGPVEGTGIERGGAVEDVAKFTANASAAYEFQISDAIKGNSRLSWQHNSPRDNTSFPIFTKGDVIDRVDARLGIEYERFEIALFAENLTNEKGATSYRTVQPIAPGIDDITSPRLRPRTFGIEALVRFSRSAR